MDKTHHDYWKTFYELLTKNYIELTFEPTFDKLIKNESPDFKSDSVGLEIVTAASDTQNTLNSLLRKYMNKKIEDIPEGFLNTLGFYKNRMYQDASGVPVFYISSEQNGIIALLQRPNGDLLLAGQIGFIPSDEFNSYMIVSKVNEKIRKLNANYELLPNNIVGVYIDYAIIPEGVDYQEEMARIMQGYIEKELLNNLNVSEKYMFDIIYICFPDVVYKYNVSSGSFDFNILDTSKISTIVNCTRNEISLI